MLSRYKQIRKFSYTIFGLTVLFFSISCTTLHVRTIKNEQNQTLPAAEKITIAIGPIKVNMRGIDRKSYVSLFENAMISSVHKISPTTDVFLYTKNNPTNLFEKNEIITLSPQINADLLIQFELNVWDSEEEIVYPEYNLIYKLEVFNLYNNDLLGTIFLTAGDVVITDADTTLDITDEFADRLFMMISDEPGYYESSTNAW